MTALVRRLTPSHSRSDLSLRRTSLSRGPSRLQRNHVTAVNHLFCRRLTTVSVQFSRNRLPACGRSRILTASPSRVKRKTMSSARISFWRTGAEKIGLACARTAESSAKDRTCQASRAVEPDRGERKRRAPRASISLVNGGWPHRTPHLDAVRARIGSPRAAGGPEEAGKIPLWRDCPPPQAGLA